MRIALQVSGELRTVRETWPTLQAILQGLDVDVFLHTWRRDDETNPFLLSHGQGIHLLNPRSYRIERYEDRADLHALPRSYSMFYSIAQANAIRKEYERLTEASYDLVIRYRTDCLLRESFLPKLPLTRGSFLWIPSSPQSDGPVQESEEEAICDWFAVGTPDTMDVYCGTYETLREIGLPVMPESMLALQLKSRGITKQTVLQRTPLDLVLLDTEGKPR